MNTITATRAVQSLLLQCCTYRVEVLDATRLEAGSDGGGGDHGRDGVPVTHGFADCHNVRHHPWNANIQAKNQGTAG